MPSRHTKLTKRNTKSFALKPHPLVPLEPGVTFSRNGIIIDASKCASFNNWAQAEGCTKEEEVLPDEDDEIGGEEGGTEPGGGQEVHDIE